MKKTKLPEFVKNHVLVAFYRGRPQEAIDHAKQGQSDEEQDLQWKLNLPEAEMLGDSGEYVSDDVVVVQEPHNAEGVTSLDPTLPEEKPDRSDFDLLFPDPTRSGDYQMHRPILDIDFPAELIPSTTEGHFHLYLDKPMTWIDYQKVLRVLSEVGIIEAGYAQASLERGYSSARLPWIKKES